MPWRMYSSAIRCSFHTASRICSSSDFSIARIRSGPRLAAFVAIAASTASPMRSRMIASSTPSSAPHSAIGRSRLKMRRTSSVSSASSHCSAKARSDKALEKAQKKVEARNFDMRKNVLKYDDVMNAQRKEVYAQRKEFMRAPDVSETISDMRDELLSGLVRRRVPEKGLAENWQLTELAADMQRVLSVALPVDEWGREEGM